MFVTISTYRAKPGEEDAIIALHEHWEQRLSSGGLASGELLRDQRDANFFIDIARFASEDVARALASDPAQDGYFQRLGSLVEAPPEVMVCRPAWTSGGNVRFLAPEHSTAH